MTVWSCSEWFWSCFRSGTFLRVDPVENRRQVLMSLQPLTGNEPDRDIIATYRR